MSEKNGWIKCSERMPEPYQSVLIFAEGLVFSAFRSEKCWTTAEFDPDKGEYIKFDFGQVDYWQEEPLPPKI